MNVLRRVTTLTFASGIALLTIGTSLAGVTNDRDYRFGDTGSTDPTLGAIVYDGQSIGFLFNGEVRTGDETGPADSDGGGPDVGGFIDVLVPGATDPNNHTGPTYADTSARPQAGAGEFGVRFDGVDDVLDGLALDIPEEFAGRLPAGSTYPIEYAGITTRGLQMWVNADAAGLASGQRQTIIQDTTEMGGVAITADGKWTQTFDTETLDSDFPATVTVSSGTWYHVMQHVFSSSDPGAPTVVPGTGGDNGVTSVVYVDGVAVASSNDFPDPGDFNADGREGRLTIGAAELGDPNDPNNPSVIYGEYFDGTVDDVTLYVYGDNETGTPGDLSDGEDWGTFNLFEDNDWIAQEIINTVPGGVLLPGDVDKDGTVELVDDVNAFVAGWLSENRIEGFAGELTVVGDWNTWDNGDMNHDGVTDLLDWAIINNANPALGAAIASALSGVPEPTSALLVLSAGVFVPFRRRKG